ncbi:hypothetical protein K440DRAFT_135412 [Wilcoxina mikolae CBS 423.85]|nr:hypothetical protein K440DRAFT_135412 [Wilcoxina mikolae CBS 423.85]
MLSVLRRRLSSAIVYCSAFVFPELSSSPPSSYTPPLFPCNLSTPLSTLTPLPTLPPCLSAPLSTRLLGVLVYSVPLLHAVVYALWHRLPLLRYLPHCRPPIHRHLSSVPSFVYQNVGNPVGTPGSSMDGTSIPGGVSIPEMGQILLNSADGRRMSSNPPGSEKKQLLTITAKGHMATFNEEYRWICQQLDPHALMTVVLLLDAYEDEFGSL